MNRRQFLRAAASATGAFSFAGLILSPQKAARAATHLSLAITAEPASRMMADGQSMPIWQYRTAPAGPGNLAGGFVVAPNDHLVIILRNNLDRAINLVIPGVLENTLPCQPGAQLSYSVTMPGSGSFMLTDGLNGDLARAMGLAAPLLIHNPADTLGNGQALNQSYTLVMQDFDSRLNAAIAAGQTFNLDSYEPNYFQVNGLSYPASTRDPSTYINTTVGQRVGLRFINGGLISYPMHFHGYHVDVVNRNRVSETRVINKDTVAVLPDECVDLSLSVNQPGLFPLHSHYLPAVTANGIYANAGNAATGEAATGGGLLMINAAGV